MNDELIEQVARACCIANDCDPDSIHEGSPIWVDWIDDAKAAIAAMQPHIEARCEDAARRALEAALDSVVTDCTIEAHGAHCRCTTCEFNIAENEIRDIDPAQFREAGNG